MPPSSHRGLLPSPLFSITIVLPASVVPTRQDKTRPKLAHVKRCKLTVQFVGYSRSLALPFRPNPLLSSPLLHHPVSCGHHLSSFDETTSREQACSSYYCPTSPQFVIIDLRHPSPRLGLSYPFLFICSTEGRASRCRGTRWGEGGPGGAAVGSG